jgi:hypothetical protein
MKGYVGEACPGMRELHARAERDLLEVRYVRQHDGVLLALRCSDGRELWRGLSPPQRVWGQ